MSDSARDDAGSNRRDFLTGRAARQEFERHGNELAEELISPRTGAPDSGDTVRLSTRAMNCEFSVVLNPSRERRPLMIASDALDLAHAIENQLTVYRETSDLLALNQQAGGAPVAVSEDLYLLLARAMEIARETQGAFHPLAAPLNALWRDCRKLGRIPESLELEKALKLSDLSGARFDEVTHSIALPNPGMGFDLGGMGKGYTLDKMADFLLQEGIGDFLLSGGHSSLLARGTHLTQGWPVGIRHPQFPRKRLASWMLTDCGFSASGSGVQYFRHQGRRYGHIFDPRTGWPVDHMLSVAVTAPSAAVADALSTAFSVLTQEETEAYCARHPEVGAILLPPPLPGSTLKPVVLNIDPRLIHWA